MKEGLNDKRLKGFASDFDDTARCVQQYFLRIRLTLEFFSLSRYKCKACNIEIYFDKSGIDAHIERHPKLTFESYSEKYETSLSMTARASNETSVKSPAKEKKREGKSPIAKLATEVKLEVNAKPPSPLEGKVKVKPPSSPAKSMMSNSSSRSSQPGTIKVQIFEAKSPWRVPCLIFYFLIPF